MATTMYTAINNSVPTQITAALTALATAISVQDASVLPAAPNLLTISTEDNAEVVRYGVVDGNTLRECVRGYHGTLAQIWPEGTLCYRAYTAADHAAFKENIEELESDMTAAQTAIAQKQDASALGEAAFMNVGTTSTAVSRGNHTHTAAAIGAAAASHTHAQTDVTGLQTALDGKAASVHTHAQADVTGLSADMTAMQTAIEQKQDASGLGAAAFMNVGTTSTTVSRGNHTHTAAAIGALPISGGTLTGSTVAAAVALGTPCIRNIYAGSSDLGDGASLATGVIYLVYE